MKNAALLATTLALLPCGSASAAPHITAAPGRVAIGYDRAYSGTEYIGAIAAGPDNTVFTAGVSGRARRPAITMLGADGAPVTSFGDKGAATISFEGVHDADGLARSADGTLTVVSRLPGRNGATSGPPVLVRASRDGVADASYGAGGRAKVPGLWSVGCVFCRVVALADDGAAYVAGSGGDIDHSRFAVARLRADGSPDPQFGTSGVSMPFEGKASASSLVVAPGGRLIVLGTGRFGSRTGSFLVGLRRDGALDPSFGSGGTVSVDENAYQIDQDAEGRVLVATAPDRKTPEVFRYTPQGVLDTAWGTGGSVSLSRMHNPRLESDGNGAIVVEDRIQHRIDGTGRIVATNRSRLLVGGGTWTRRVPGLVETNPMVVRGFARRSDGSLAIAGDATIEREMGESSTSAGEGVVAFVDAHGRPEPTVKTGPPRPKVKVRRGLRVRLTPAARGLALIRVKARRRTVGEAMTGFWSTRAKTVHVKLPAWQRRRLSSVRRVQVAVTVNDMAGNIARVTRTVRLR